MDSLTNCVTVSFCQFPIEKNNNFLSPSAESPPDCIGTSVQRHGVESTQPHPRDPTRGDACGAVPAEFLVLFHLLYFEPLKCIICHMLMDNHGIYIYIIYLCLL